MPAVKYGGVSVDHTDKKPYVHARRSTKNSSIGGAAKSKKDFGFDMSYHKEKISGGVKVSKNKDGNRITFGIRAKFAKGGDVMPKRNPIKEFFSVFPKAMITIPTEAIKIDTHTLSEIFSFKNK